MGEASATILSYTTPIGGQASLEVDWGDGDNQTYSTDAISGGAYAYDHAYRSPGLYEIRAVATVKQLGEDGTTWEKTITEELVSTVQVRNDCYGTDTGGNRGFEEAGSGIVGSILSNWYGQMMEEAIEFSPIDGHKCFRGDVSVVNEDEMTTITLASIWSGNLTLTVDWGDGLDNQYESIPVVRGLSQSFNHVWAAPGLYTIVASAVVKRPTLDGNDYEVIREELVANVEVDDNCATDDIAEDGLVLAGGNEGTITGDWSFFDFGPTDDYLCRSAGEKSTALSLMSIFSGELTMDVSISIGCFFPDLTNKKIHMCWFLTMLLLLSFWHPNFLLFSLTSKRLNGETIAPSSILWTSSPESPIASITSMTKPERMRLGPPPE